MEGGISGDVFHERGKGRRLAPGLAWAGTASPKGWILDSMLLTAISSRERVGSSSVDGSREGYSQGVKRGVHQQPCRCVQREEALSKKLVHHLLIVCLDFRDHVTGNKAKPGTGFPTVESISIFITINLEPQEEVQALWLVGSEIHQFSLQKSHTQPNTYFKNTINHLPVCCRCVHVALPSKSTSLRSVFPPRLVNPLGFPAYRDCKRGHGFAWMSVCVWAHTS